jgi:hypothetical protein
MHKQILISFQYQCRLTSIFLICFHQCNSILLLKYCIFSL